jgi:Ca2+-binding EF-hand superfamily protein
MKSVKQEFDSYEFAKIFREMDLDGNGLIEKNEMVSFLAKIWQTKV